MNLLLLHIAIIYTSTCNSENIYIKFNFLNLLNNNKLLIQF